MTACSAVKLRIQLVHRNIGQTLHMLISRHPPFRAHLAEYKTLLSAKPRFTRTVISTRRFSCEKPGYVRNRQWRSQIRQGGYGNGGEIPLCSQRPADVRQDPQGVIEDVTIPDYLTGCDAKYWSRLAATSLTPC